MNYADIKNVDVANGEGVRVSLFVSGCTNNCKGCFNKEAQDFNYGQEYTEETGKRILELLKPEYIQGLSILGGEPLEPKNQETVLNLVKQVKEIYPDKNIWCYSGFTIEELLKRENPITDELLSNIDVLVDGKFVEELKNPGLEFRGSSNQRIINVKEYLKTMEINNQILCRDGDLYIRQYNNFYALERINDDVGMTLCIDEDLAVVKERFEKEIAMNNEIEEEEER